MGPEKDDLAQRRPALVAGMLVAAILLAVSVLTDGWSPWLLIAAPIAVAIGAAVTASNGPGGQKNVLVASDQRIATAEAILANIPDPVILVDRRAVVIEANGAALNLLPGIRKRHPLSFALRAPSVLDGVDQVLRAGEVRRIEFTERVPTERVYEVQIGPLETPSPLGGSENGVVLYFRDLTSSRRLEHMRVDFIANASHELRTPLASVLGFIETLQGPARNDSAAQAHFLEIMRQQALRMTRLIDDLLSLSRIELRAHVPPEAQVDLRLVVRQILDSVRPLALDKGIAVTADLPQEPATILGDHDELLRVVENLVENAIKYGESGKSVEVSVVRSAYRAGRAPEAISLRVRDRGPGIAPEHLPRLTERFYRADIAQSRQKGGTGLGLAIVKHIVNRHRGRLLIESTLGQGATFTAEFPAAPGQVGKV